MNGRTGGVILKSLVLGLALLAATPARPARAQVATVTLAITPKAQNLAAGGLVMYTVTTASKGSSEILSLSASGLPSGVTASFSPASLPSGQASTLTLSASSSASNGTATFTVGGTSAQSSASATASATVSVSGGTGGGGGCPPGSIDIGGICIPAGCSYAPGGRWENTAVALPALLALAAARRRRRRR